MLLGEWGRYLFEKKKQLIEERIFLSKPVNWKYIFMCKFSFLDSEGNDCFPILKLCWHNFLLGWLLTLIWCSMLPKTFGYSDLMRKISIFIPILTEEVIIFSSVIGCYLIRLVLSDKKKMIMYSRRDCKRNVLCGLWSSVR